MSHTISVLGSTGSVGTQALDVARRQGYRVEALSAGSNIELLEVQAREFSPKYIAVNDPDSAEEFKVRTSGKYKVFSGQNGICEMIDLLPPCLVINSIIGSDGLKPTLEAVKTGHDVALANKETMVIAGELVMSQAKKSGVKILPVDSEHSAIFQCLEGNRSNVIKRILLTASGGPFFGMKREELAGVTVERALAHPTWKMGKKITLDSATLMNKGFEIIEAVRLFDVPEDKVEVVIHRESVIHSMVEFEDRTVIAQLGIPDMRSCIQYAVTYPDRVDFGSDGLDFYKIGKLSFYKPDTETFSLLECARKAVRRGGTAPAVLEASNRAAADLFFEHKISFTEIFDLVEKALCEVGISETVSLDSIALSAAEARDYIAEQAGKRR